MMTALLCTPFRPGMGCGERATMNGYAASTLLVKKNLALPRTHCALMWIY